MEKGECHIHLSGLVIKVATATKIAVNVVSPKNSVIYSWKSDARLAEHKLSTNLPVLCVSLLLDNNWYIEAFLTEFNFSSFFGITDVASEYQIQIYTNKYSLKIGKEDWKIILKQADFVLRHSNFKSHPIQFSGPGNVILQIEYCITSPITMEYQLLSSEYRSFALQELQELIQTNRIETYFSYQPLIIELFNLLKKYIRKPKIIATDGEQIESLWKAVISNPKSLHQTMNILPDLSSRIWSIIVKDNCRHHGQYHIAFLTLRAAAEKRGEKYLPTFISSFCQICTEHCHIVTTETLDPATPATVVPSRSPIFLLPYLASGISCNSHSFIPSIITKTDILKHLYSALAFAKQLGMGNEFCSPLFGLVRYFGKSNTLEIEKNRIFEPILSMALDSSVPMRQVEAFSTLGNFGKMNVPSLVESAKETKDLNAQLSYLQATQDVVESQNLERADYIALAASVAPFLLSKLEPAVSISSNILKRVDLTIEEGTNLEFGKQYCHLLELPDSSPVALDYFLWQFTRWSELCVVNSKSPKRASARSHRGLSTSSPTTGSGISAHDGPRVETNPNEDVYFKLVELPSSLVNQLIAAHFFRCLSTALQTKFHDIRVQFHLALWLALFRSNSILLEPYSNYLSFIDSLSELISVYYLRMPHEHIQLSEDIFLLFTIAQLGILTKDPNSDSSRSFAVKMRKVLSSPWVNSLSFDSYSKLDRNSGPSSKEVTIEMAHPSERVSSIIKLYWPSYVADLIKCLSDLANFQLEYLDAIIGLIFLNVVPKTISKADRLELLVLLSHTPSLVRRHRGPLAPYDAPPAPEHDQFQILIIFLRTLFLGSDSFKDLDECEALQVICWLSHALEATLWIDPSSIAISRFDATLITHADLQEILTTLISLHDAFGLSGTKLVRVTFSSSFRPWYQQLAFIDFLMRSEPETPHFPTVGPIPSIIRTLGKLKVLTVSYLSALTLDSSFNSSDTTEEKNFPPFAQSPPVRLAILEATLKDIVWSSTCPHPSQIKNFVQSLHREWFKDVGLRSVLEQRQFRGRLSFLFHLTHLTLFLAAYDETAVLVQKKKKLFLLEQTITGSYENSFVVQSLRLLDFPTIPTSFAWAQSRWWAMCPSQTHAVLEWVAGIDVSPHPWTAAVHELSFHFSKFDWKERMELLKKALEVLGGVWETIPLNDLLPIDENSMLDILSRSFGQNSSMFLARHEAAYLTYALRPFCLASIYPCPSVNKFALSWLTKTAWTRLFSTSSQQTIASLRCMSGTAANGSPSLHMPMGAEWLHEDFQNMFLVHFNDPNAISQLVSALQSFMIEGTKLSTAADSISESLKPMLFQYCLHLRHLLLDPMGWELENAPLETGNWTDADELGWFTFPTKHSPRCTPTDFQAHLLRHNHHFLMRKENTSRPFVFNAEPFILQEFRKFTGDGDENIQLGEKHRIIGIEERVKIYIAAFCDAITSIIECLAQIAFSQAVEVPKMGSTDFNQECNPANPISNQPEYPPISSNLDSVCFAARMMSEFYAGEGGTCFRNSSLHSLADNSRSDSKNRMPSSSPKIDGELLESDVLLHTTWKVFGVLMKFPEALDLATKVSIGMGTRTLIKIDASKEVSVLKTSHPLWLSSVLPVISTIAPFVGKSIYEPYSTFASFEDSQVQSSMNSPSLTEKSSKSKKKKDGANHGSVASLMASYFYHLISLVDKDLDEVIFILQKVAENMQKGVLDETGLPHLPPSAVGDCTDVSLAEEAQGPQSSNFARIVKWQTRMDQLGNFVQMMLNLLRSDVRFDTNELMYGPLAHEHIGDPLHTGDPLDGLHGPVFQKLTTFTHLLSTTENKLRHRLASQSREHRVANGVDHLLIHVISTPKAAVKALSHEFWNQWVGGGRFRNLSNSLNLPFCVSKLMALSGHLEGASKFPLYIENLSKQVGEQIMTRHKSTSVVSSIALLPIVSLASHYQQSFYDWDIDRNPPKIQDHVLICYLCDIWNSRPGAALRLFKRGEMLGLYNFHAFLERRWFVDANETKAGNRFVPSYSDHPEMMRYSSALYESEKLASLKRKPSPAKSSIHQESALSVQSSDQTSLKPSKKRMYPTLYLGIPSPANSDDKDWKDYVRVAPAFGNNFNYLIYALHAQRVSMGVTDQQDLIPGDLDAYKTYLRTLGFNRNFVPFSPIKISHDISKEDFKSNGLVVSLTFLGETSSIHYFVIPTNKVVNVWWPQLEIDTFNQSDLKLLKLHLDELLSPENTQSTFRIGWATASGLKRLNEQPFLLVGDVKGTFGFSFIECGCFKEGAYVPFTTTINLGTIEVNHLPRIDLEYHPMNRSIHAQTLAFPKETPKETFPMLLSMLLPLGMETEVLFPVCSFTSYHSFRLASV